MMHSYPIVIGVSPKCALAGREKGGHAWVKIYRMAKQYPVGTRDVDLQDVESFEKEIWFCHKENLKAFIDILQEIYDEW